MTILSFNLKREASPLATLGVEIACLLPLEFQSQARSQSPSDGSTNARKAHTGKFQSQARSQSPSDIKHEWL